MCRRRRDGVDILGGRAKYLKNILMVQSRELCPITHHVWLREPNCFAAFDYGNWCPRKHWRNAKRIIVAYT
jgi:hypothetical protein